LTSSAEVWSGIDGRKTFYPPMSIRDGGIKSGLKHFECGVIVTQASSDNGLLVRHWYHTDTSPASQSSHATSSAHQPSTVVNHLYRVRPAQADQAGRPMFTNNAHVLQRASDDDGYATAVRSLSYNAVSLLIYLFQ